MCIVYLDSVQGHYMTTIVIKSTHNHWMGVIIDVGKSNQTLINIILYTAVHI